MEKHFMLASLTCLLTKVTTEEYQGISEDVVRNLLFRVDQLEAKVTSDADDNSEIAVLRIENAHAKTQTKLLLDEVRALRENTDRQQCIKGNNMVRNKDVPRVSKYRAGNEHARAALVQLPIAFSAFVSLEHVTNLGTNQNIIFDHVETNMGSAYNNHHGVFIAPTTVLYLFTVSMTSYVNTEFQASITVNGRHVANIFTHGTIREDQGLQTTVLRLNSGDDVSVQVLIAGNGILGSNYSSFSGYLLAQLEPACSN